mmetsp:Transcript_20953/g.66115  ORF Transcript_20953/g.66115 Transcript_20953/m.66115 type:complete len:251 (-) Transcript_20953:367-1119(-)
MALTPAHRQDLVEVLQAGAEHHKPPDPRLQYAVHVGIVEGELASSEVLAHAAEVDECAVVVGGDVCLVHMGAERRVSRFSLHVIEQRWVVQALEHGAAVEDLAEVQGRAGAPPRALQELPSQPEALRAQVPPRRGPQHQQGFRTEALQARGAAVQKRREARGLGLRHEAVLHEAHAGWARWPRAAAGHAAVGAPPVQGLGAGHRPGAPAGHQSARWQQRLPALASVDARQHGQLLPLLHQELLNLLTERP